MRVLFVLHQFMPEFAAGTENVTLNLARMAQAGGHHVEVLACSVRGAEFWRTQDDGGLRSAMVEGVPVFAIPAAAETTLADLGFSRQEPVVRAVQRFLNERPAYDVVHVTHAMRMLDAVEIIRDSGLPYIITLTDFFLDCYRITLIRRSGELCDGPEGGAQCIASCPIEAQEQGAMFARLARTRAILDGAACVNACSHQLADVFLREHPGLEIRVVPHGVDLLRFDYRTRRQEGPEVVFGYLGTLSQDKGVHVLAEAFVRASPPNARLELIGPGFDPIFLERLRDLIDGRSDITLHPPLHPAEVPAALGRFDLLCLPSMWPETFSLVINEGFAAGLPCIVSDAGAPADTVRRNACGEVVPVGDVDAWAQAIERAAASPDLLRTWRDRVPLPQRVEEEGFLYDQLYREAGSFGRLRQA